MPRIPKCALCNSSHWRKLLINLANTEKRESALCPWVQPMPGLFYCPVSWVRGGGTRRIHHKLPTAASTNARYSKIPPWQSFETQPVLRAAEMSMQIAKHTRSAPANVASTVGFPGCEFIFVPRSAPPSFAFVNGSRMRVLPGAARRENLIITLVFGNYQIFRNIENNLLFSLFLKYIEISSNSNIVFWDSIDHVHYLQHYNICNILTYHPTLSRKCQHIIIILAVGNY